MRYWQDAGHQGAGCQCLWKSFLSHTDALSLSCGFAACHEGLSSAFQVLITVPLRALLDQFALDFPGFCKVGQGHNQKIDFGAKGFVAVTKSVHLLKNLRFEAVFVDEAHHPVLPGMPKYKEQYRFSATHTDEPDFKYAMGQAIDDGVLCDYDIAVPVVTEHHAYVCLADLLVKQAGRFRRVLAYCNSVAEAKKFKMVVEELGLAAWHINAATSLRARLAAIKEFSGNLTNPVHVMVTVEVLGEGINIPNADTCMFVEPRHSYRSVIQAIGRVLRHHPCKTLAHIVLPAVAMPAKLEVEEAASQDPHASPVPSVESNPYLHQDEEATRTFLEGARTSAETKRQDQTSPEVLATGGRAEVGHSEELNLDQYLGGTFRESNQPAEGMQLDRRQPPDAAAAGTTHVGKEDPTGPSGNFFASLSGLSTPHPLPVLETSAKSLQAGRPEIAHLHHKQDEAGKACDANSDSWLVLRNDGATAQAQTPVGNMELDSFAGTSVPFASSLLAEETHWWPDMEASDSAACEAATPFAAGQEADYQTPRVRIRGSSPSTDCGECFGTQLERFLSLLVQADERLVGSKLGHRIQLVDCRLALEGELGGWAEEVYSRLTAILQQSDPWEQRLHHLEEFAAANGRLPRRGGKYKHEETLSNWLYAQCVRRTRGLRHSRLQRLLHSPSLLLRQRVEGWLSGDPDCRFKRRCLQLRQYIHRYGKLPGPSSGKRGPSDTLGTWIRTQRWVGTLLNPHRRAMLESVHPLVANVITEWDAAHLQVNHSAWQARFHTLVELVKTNGRLPGSKTGLELAAYKWFDRQLRRLQKLPQELVLQLRKSHPLIAAAIHAEEAKRIAGQQQLISLQARTL